MIDNTSPLRNNEKRNLQGDNLSELDKLMQELGFRYEPSEGGYYIHRFVNNPKTPTSLNSVLVPEVAKKINDLIRTEKLKLLAEVRERVVGEDLPPDVATDSGIGYSRQRFAINRGKAGQRTVLTQLEAEQ